MEREQDDIVVDAIGRFIAGGGSAEAAGSIEKLAFTIATERSVPMDATDVRDAYGRLGAWVRREANERGLNPGDWEELAKKMGQPELARCFALLLSSPMSDAAVGAQIVSDVTAVSDAPRGVDVSPVTRRRLFGRNPSGVVGLPTAGSVDPDLARRIEESRQFIASLKEGNLFETLTRPTREALDIMSGIFELYLSGAELSVPVRKDIYAKCNVSEIVTGYEELSKQFEYERRFGDVYRCAVDVAFSPGQGRPLTPAETLDIASGGIGTLMSDDRKSTFLRARAALENLTAKPSAEERRELAALACELHFLPGDFRIRTRLDVNAIEGSSESEPRSDELPHAAPALPPDDGVRRRIDTKMFSHLWGKINPVADHFMGLALANPSGQKLSSFEKLGILVHGEMGTSKLLNRKSVVDRLNRYLRIIEALQQPTTILNINDRRDAIILIDNLRRGWSHRWGSHINEDLPHWVAAIDGVIFPIPTAKGGMTREQAQELADLLRERAGGDANLDLFVLQSMATLLKKQSPSLDDVVQFSQKVRKPSGAAPYPALDAAVNHLIQSLEDLAGSHRATSSKRRALRRKSEA